eukprot:TRINITY_DN10915_c0_g1_i1.p1 TRINITY_DN10915_c0_g1~~TRINITY_DN10915_c0_g1_i1.p1  ORF type:complete len:144 (-),score=16.81 TRINITY_DN10915_c0_g1_i1:170-601(-)
MGHSSWGELPVIVDRGAGNPVLTVTVGGILKPQWTVLRISHDLVPRTSCAATWCRAVGPKGPPGTEGSPGTLQGGWHVWHRDADKSLEQQAFETAQLRAKLAASKRPKLNVEEVGDTGAAADEQILAKWHRTSSPEPVTLGVP